MSKFHIEERIWRGTKRRPTMSKPKTKEMDELNKDEPLNHLSIIWSWSPKDVEKQEQAYNQIKKIIQNQPEVDEEFIEKWVNIIRPETPNSIRIALKDMLKEAGYHVVKKPEITMKEIQGWADAARERVTNHEDWGYLVGVFKEMLEEIGVVVKNG